MNVVITEEDIVLIKAAYSTHVVTHRVDTGHLQSWTIRREDGKGNLWATVVVVSGRIMITGDGPDMIINARAKSGVGAMRWLASASTGYYLSSNMHKAQLDALEASYTCLDEMSRNEFMGVLTDVDPDAFERTFGVTTTRDVYWVKAIAARIVELEGEK